MPAQSKRFGVRIWVATAAALTLVAGVSLISISVAEAQNRPRAAAPKAPPAPPAPPVRVVPAFNAPPGVEPLSFAAQTYAMYHADLGQLRSQPMRSAQEMNAILDRVAAHNPHHLSRGLLAYGALVAAQSEPFAQTVRSMATFFGRDKVVAGLVLGEDYARGIAGAEDAERLIAAAFAADGNRIIEISNSFRQHASEAQRTRWGGLVTSRMAQRAGALRAIADGAPMRTVPTELGARLAPTVGSAAPRTDPTAFGGAAFWDVWRQGPTGTAAAAAAPAPIPTPVTTPASPPQGRERDVNTMLRLAALYILDATKDPAVPVAEFLTKDQTTDRCLDMTQVQLQQCVSAARFNYETAYCLAEQGMQNVGECIREGRQIQ